MSTKGYEPLMSVFARAVEQAASGKGKERHAGKDEPFIDQKIVQLCTWMGSNQGDIFQACKKALESTRMDRDRAVRELLGALNYLAAAVLVLEQHEEPKPERGRDGPCSHPIEAGHGSSDGSGGCSACGERWGPKKAAPSQFIDPGPLSQRASRVPVRLAGGRLPAYQTAGASGLDLCSKANYCIKPGERLRVDTGVHCAIPQGYEGQVRPRSSMNAKGILGLFGTIDADYRGDIGVLLWNTTSAPFYIEVGDRVGQLVIAPVCRAELQVVDQLPTTERGEGGWGSTGK